MPPGPQWMVWRPRVAGALGDLRRLDGAHDLRLLGVRLGVEDVQARGAQPRHDQIAPFDVGMGRVRAQARAASVPAEMVQLVVGRELGLADDLRRSSCEPGSTSTTAMASGRRRFGSKSRRTPASPAGPARPGAARDRRSDQVSRSPWFVSPCCASPAALAFCQLGVIGDRVRRRLGWWPLLSQSGPDARWRGA